LNLPETDTNPVAYPTKQQGKVQRCVRQYVAERSEMLAVRWKQAMGGDTEGNTSGGRWSKVLLGEFQERRMTTELTALKAPKILFNLFCFLSFSFVFLDTDKLHQNNLI